MHDGVFVVRFIGSLCRPGRSNAALFDKVFDEVSDKVFPEGFHAFDRAHETLRPREERKLSPGFAFLRVYSRL
jgi:hypothetical protein